MLETEREKEKINKERQTSRCVNCTINVNTLEFYWYFSSMLCRISWLLEHIGIHRPK